MVRIDPHRSGWSGSSVVARICYHRCYHVVSGSRERSPNGAPPNSRQSTLPRRGLVLSFAWSVPPSPTSCGSRMLSSQGLPSDSLCAEHQRLRAEPATAVRIGAASVLSISSKVRPFGSYPNAQKAIPEHVPRSEVDEGGAEHHQVRDRRVDEIAS